MIKKNIFTPILMLSLLFNGCIEDTISRPASGLGTIPVEYKTSRKDVEAKLLEIFPSEKVLVLTGAEQKDGGPKTNHLTIEFNNPQVFPDNDSVLDVQIEAVREEAMASIDNVEEYRQLVILFQEEMEENGLSKSRSIQKEISIGEGE